MLDLNLNNSLGAISWITKSFTENLINTINTISLESIIRYSYILIINICVIIYFVRFKKQIILFSKKLTIIEIIILLVFLSLPAYLIVLDWGRIIYLNYNFMIITIIFFFNQKLIDIVYLNKKIKKISFKIKILIFIFICILFSPKILINDDLSGFPLYKSINKFQKNIRSLY